MSRLNVDWGGRPLPVILPELVVLPSHAQVFMFSAITWNRHHIHYNRDAAIAEGLPDIVVQRALIGNYFVRLLTNWLADGGEIKKISWKVIGSAVPDKRLRCQGTVVEHAASPTGPDDLACQMVLVNDAEEILATANATVCIQEPS